MAPTDFTVKLDNIALCNGVRGLKCISRGIIRRPKKIALCNGVRGLKCHVMLTLN